MAKRLTKGKRKYLLSIMAEVAWRTERDRRAEQQARALMFDYRGRTPHQVIW
ncbi:hypothetical protein ST201phi2-1p024 [Pseudomonas phage 201phi2-1]|uniref:Uncharacterized protein n=1 Tax=Pseudomonas phage 201phi2-1 TaxID=198110 RepID=B3FK00_BP201|nr:hypothetical protein ST201phi2-1p024 [Pseudomonas phage 201phi2-1]ABY62858.1 hypothetical protein 201phi2-1p024 [Pseudomonas phage 201phi2-1]